MAEAPPHRQTLEEWRAQLDYGAEMARRLEHQESYMNEQRLKLFGLFVTSGTIYAGGACVVLIQAASGGVIETDGALAGAVAAFAITGLILIISAGIGALSILINERHLTHSSPPWPVVLGVYWLCYLLAACAAVGLTGSTLYALHNLAPA